MKNLLYIVIALALIGGAYYFLQNKQASEVAEDADMTQDEDMDMDMSETEEDMADTSMPVPEPGNENVDEMVDDTTEDTSSEVDAEAKVFDVSGQNFGFDVTEIRVKRGDTVTINFTSTDGFHDWVVDEFSAAAERVETGGESSVTFVADATGTFEYYCSVGQHRANGMVGTLIVE